MYHPLHIDFQISFRACSQVIPVAGESGHLSAINEIRLSGDEPPKPTIGTIFEGSPSQIARRGSLFKERVLRSAQFYWIKLGCLEANFERYQATRSKACGKKVHVFV